MNNYKARLKIGQLEFEVEGDKEFVESQIQAWKTEQVDSFGKLLSNESKKASDETSTAGETEVTLPEFYNRFVAVSHPDKIAIFGYFFEKFKHQEFFTAQDLLAAYDEVRFPAPKNIHDILGKVYKRSNYILPREKGTWKLQARGIEFIENGIEKRQK
jgi:hypothetical protein